MTQTTNDPSPDELLKSQPTKATTKPKRIRKPRAKPTWPPFPAAQEPAIEITFRDDPEPARHIWHGTCGHDWDFTEIDLAALHSGERAKPLCPICPEPVAATSDSPYHPHRMPDDWIADIVDMTGSLNAMMHSARTLCGITFEFVPGNPNGEQLRIINIQKPKESP